jgi:metal-responsive CopG/Arc/MetJ family transcriptional regulator
MSLVRFEVGLEEDILKALDTFVIENSISNRSQAIRQLVEKNIVENNGFAIKWSPGLLLCFTTITKAM